MGRSPFGWIPRSESRTRRGLRRAHVGIVWGLARPEIRHVSLPALHEAFFIDPAPKTIDLADCLVGGAFAGGPHDAGSRTRENGTC